MFRVAWGKTQQSSGTKGFGVNGRFCVALRAMRSTCSFKGGIMRSLTCTLRWRHWKPSCACGRWKSCEKTWAISRAAKQWKSRSLYSQVHNLLKSLAYLAPISHSDLPTLKPKIVGLNCSVIRLQLTWKAHQPTSKWIWSNSNVATHSSRSMTLLVLQFPRFIPDTMPQLRAQVAQMLSMFGSTYLCEQLFSVMKLNKTSHRSYLTDEHLHSILKISSAQSLTPNIEELALKKRYQLSGSGTRANNWALM